MQLMWVRASVYGLVANNLGPVAEIVGLGCRIVAENVVQKRGLFAGRADYDCGPLHLLTLGAQPASPPKNRA